MTDPLSNPPDDTEGLPSDLLATGGLDLEAGLAAAFGTPAWEEVEKSIPRILYQPNTVIAGKFRLIEQIGEGGMGTVWYAEQTIPIKRKVAIKLIKPGLDSRSVVARFDAERQALALMDHPNIAKVFDGGITDSGYPFFAMELVKGTSLTKFCDERRLDLTERIRMFISVCQAIQHAHQKGVIHRDIKPSNIMVALYDGKPVPKVIDFGVAKAVGPPLTDVPLHTDFGAVVGTAEYMSPEQAELNNLDIDTRSDVYSLGVLMYELLAGTPPFSRSELGLKGVHEVLRVIREVDPQRPSAKLSTSKMRASIAALRSIEPSALGKLLSGDLDWIIMKSLEKERSRRYDSPLALAQDLEKFLHNEPVDAYPPSTAYRLRKFFRRYRWQSLAAILMLGLLIAGIVGTSLSYFRAESMRRLAVNAQIAADDRAKGERRARQDALQQKELAEKAEDATLESYRASTDDAIEKLIISKAALTAYERSYLENALERWQAFANRQGDNERNRAIGAEAHFRVATIWDLLGDLDRAGEEYDRSADLWKQLGDEFPEKGLYLNESSRCRRNQSNVLRKLYKVSEAESIMRQAIVQQQGVLEKFPTHPAFRQEMLRELTSLAILLSEVGKTDEALATIRQTVSQQQNLVKEYPTVNDYLLSLAVCHFNYAKQLESLGDAEAEAQFRLALESYERLVANNPTILLHRSGLADCLNALGKNLARAGKLEEVETMLRRSVATMQSLAREFPSAPEFRERLSNVHQDLGWFLNDYLTRTSDAEVEYRSATEVREKLVTDYPTMTDYRRGLAGNYFTLGFVLSHQGKFEAGKQEYLKSLAMREQLAAEFPILPGHKIDLGWCFCNIGQLEFDQGNTELSKSWADKAIQSGNDVFERQPQSVNARTLLQYSYRLRARARKLMADDGFQEDWDHLLALTPDDGTPQNRLARATILGDAGQIEKMLQEIESLVWISPNPEGSGGWTPVNWYELACMFCRASEHFPDRQRELTDRAMELLRKAVDSGFQEVNYLKRDENLNALRDRDEFQRIVDQLEQVKKSNR